MGSHNGTYVPWHESVWGHAKTKAAAAVLVAAGVPIEYAAAIVGRALHALSCWALRDGDTGHTGRLTDAELAQVAWPEGVSRGRWRPAKIGELLRDALHAGSLLVDRGASEAIHDFHDHCAHILKHRRSNLDTGHQREAGKRSAEARRAKTGSSQPNRRAEPAPNRDGSDAPNRDGCEQAEPSASASASACVHAEPNRPEPAEHGFATTPTSPPPQPSEPSGLGRSRRLDPALPDPAEEAHDPPTPKAAELGRLARSLELRIDCAYVQAWKRIQALDGWGMTVAEIRAAIDSTPGGKQAPWTWAEHVHRQHRDAKAGHIA